MKKTLLATALAVGFAGVAPTQAQTSTSVTLYGILDTAVSHIQYKNKRTGVKIRRSGATESVERGNRWGLRGSEDLGGGSKALFTLESGFGILTGNSAQGNRLFGRQAWLGIANDDWGQVAFGRQYNMAVQFQIGYIALPWSDAHEAANSGATFTSLRTLRYDNMISYKSPVISGFQFGAGYSFNWDGSQAYKVDSQPDGNTKVITLGMAYRNGPLRLAATYDHANLHKNFIQPVGATGKDVKAWVLGGSYDFGPVTLHLGYGQDRNGVFATRGAALGASGIPTTSFSRYAALTPFANADSYKTNNYSVGFGVPLGNDNRIEAAWQSSRLGSGAFKDARDKSSQDRYSVVYTQKLSKRTQLFAVATHGTGYAFDNVTVNQVLVGLGHTF